MPSPECPHSDADDPTCPSQTTSGLHIPYRSPPWWPWGGHGCYPQSVATREPATHVFHAGTVLASHCGFQAWQPCSHPILQGEGRRGKQSCRLSANRVDSAHHANRGRGKREAMEAEDRRRAGGGRLPPLSDCPVPAPRPPRVRRRPRFAVVPVPGPMPTHSTAPAGSSNDHVFDLDGISGRYQGSAVPSITLDSQSLHPGATLLHTSLLNHHQSTGIHGARQGHSC